MKKEFFPTFITVYKLTWPVVNVDAMQLILYNKKISIIVDWNHKSLEKNCTSIIQRGGNPKYIQLQDKCYHILD